jgi:methionyl-tRNA formyltransferase
MLRVALFGSGSPLSLAVLDAVGQNAALVAVVVPASPRRFRKSAIGRAAAAHGAIVIEDDPAKLRALNLDLMVIATYGRRISDDLLAIPRLGTLNVHPSLLPRHRGADPLFWTYFHGDDSTGVTVHWATREIDAGPIVAQVEVAIPRGMPVNDLYGQMAARAATLTGDVVARLAAGAMPGERQDADRATLDPRPRAGAFNIDFAQWPVERLWHFLSGLSVRRADLLPRLHGRAKRWERVEHTRAPGTIETIGGAMRVWARDGYVDLERPSLRARLRHLLRP